MQPLSDAELQEVNKKFSVNLFYKDEKASRLRVLVYGKIKLLRRTFEGKDVLLEMLQPGDFFRSLSEFEHLSNQSVYDSNILE